MPFDFEDMRRAASKAAGAGADWFEQKGLVVPIPGQKPPVPPLGPGGIPIMYGLTDDRAVQPRQLMGRNPLQMQQMNGGAMHPAWQKAFGSFGLE